MGQASTGRASMAEIVSDTLNARENVVHTPDEIIQECLERIRIEKSKIELLEEAIVVHKKAIEKYTNRMKPYLIHEDKMAKEYGPMVV